MSNAVTDLISNSWSKVTPYETSFKTRYMAVISAWSCCPGSIKSQGNNLVNLSHSLWRFAHRYVRKTTCSPFWVWYMRLQSSSAVEGCPSSPTDKSVAMSWAKLGCPGDDTDPNLLWLDSSTGVHHCQMCPGGDRNSLIQFVGNGGGG